MLSDPSNYVSLLPLSTTTILASLVMMNLLLRLAFSPCASRWGVYISWRLALATLDRIKDQAAFTPRYSLVQS